MARKKPNLAKYKIIILIPFFLLATWFFAQPQKNALPQTGYDIVQEVIDGDTFVLPGKQRVRLKRVQAPELKHCGGPEARSRLEKLVLGKEVTLKNIVVDQYRRIVAMVYQNDQLINEVLVKEGRVQYLGASEEGKIQLQTASDYARKNQLGIYSQECLSLNPPQPNCLIKGNVAQDSTHTKIYHFPGCSNYANITVERFLGDDWFCSEHDAQTAGFTKSKNCYGKSF